MSVCGFSYTTATGCLLQLLAWRMHHVLLIRPDKTILNRLGRPCGRSSAELAHQVVTSEAELRPGELLQEGCATGTWILEGCATGTWISTLAANPTCTAQINNRMTTRLRWFVEGAKTVGFQPEGHFKASRISLMAGLEPSQPLSIYDNSYQEHSCHQATTCRSWS